MLKTIKKYVLKMRHAYHKKRSDYCYEQVNDWDERSVRVWGERTAYHTYKCLELRKLEES